MSKVRYTGDGTAYVPGRPAIKGYVEDVDAATATGLIDTGLYERVKSESDKPAKKKTASKTPEAKAPEPADDSGDRAPEGGDS